MKSLTDARLPGQLLLLAILIALLGVSPRSHLATRDLHNARRAAQAGSLRKAASYLAAAAQSQPGRTDLWEQAGRYALQAGDPQAAIDYLQRVARMDFTEQANLTHQGGLTDQGGLTHQGLIDLGDAYQQAGNLPAAIQSWQVALASGSPASPLHQRLYEAYISLGDYPAAIGELQALSTLDPSDAQYHYQLGLLVATQQPEASLEHFAQAARLDAGFAGPVEALRRSILSARIAEDQAYSLLAAGRALASLGEWSLSAEAFRQATLARADYAEAWAYLGEARQHLEGESETAGQPVSLASTHAAQQNGFAELQKALSLDPDSLSGHTFMALFWSRQGRHDLALEELKTASRLDPKNPVLHAQIGETLATLGDLQAAHQAYRRAVALAPRDSATYRLLAGFSLKYEFEMDEIALPAARQAVVLAPKEAANLDLMGQTLIRLNDLRNAERFLHRAVGADPDYAPAHLHLGMLYVLLGEQPRAHQEFILARSLATPGPVAQQAQRLLQNYFP